ncbi:hypothetical protein UA70_20450, partial [Raoultella planticola]
KYPNIATLCYQAKAIYFDLEPLSGQILHNDSSNRLIIRNKVVFHSPKADKYPNIATLCYQAKAIYFDRTVVVVLSHILEGNRLHASDCCVWCSRVQGSHATKFCYR